MTRPSPAGVLAEETRRYLEIPDVGEEEADEGEGQVPFRHRADDVSRVALEKEQTALNTGCEAAPRRWSENLCSGSTGKTQNLH